MVVQGGQVGEHAAGQGEWAQAALRCACKAWPADVLTCWVHALAVACSIIMQYIYLDDTGADIVFHDGEHAQQQHWQLPSSNSSSHNNRLALLLSGTQQARSYKT